MNYLDGRICNDEGLNNVDDDVHSDVKKLFAFFYSFIEHEGIKIFQII
jgi:hypothetical protein